MSAVEDYREPWQTYGLCVGKDPAIWFPYEQTTGPYNWERGKGICDVCPVKDSCLSWAISHIPDGETGLWGGATPDERKSLKRSARARRREARGQITVCELANCNEPATWSRWCSEECAQAERARRARIAK